MEQNDLLQHASTIVSAFVTKNSVPAADVPSLIKSVHGTLSNLMSGSAAEGAQTPMVPVKRSITPEYLVCLEDGKKLKMLKRYLRTRFDLTPEQYRAKWGLPSTYPMVAPSYSKSRSDFAKKIGLGRAAPRRRTKK